MRRRTGLAERARRALALARSNTQRFKGLAGILRFDAETAPSMAEMLERQAARQPRETFLAFEGRRWSWGRFAQHVARRASALRLCGLQQGDVVALIMPNRPAFLINALALQRIGAIPALINTGLVGTGLRHAVTVAEPVAAIVDSTLVADYGDAFADRDDRPRILVDIEGNNPRPDLLGPRRPAVGLVSASQLRARRVVDLFDVDDRLAPDSAAPLAPVTGTDVAAYIYTSGTTGLPKAGRVLHARVAIAGHGFGEAVPGMRRDDRMYCSLPLFHSNGFIVALGTALHCGASFALARRFSASRFWTDIASTEATCFCYIGEVCRYLLNAPAHPEERSHRLRYIIGNGMRPEVWRPFVERFRPGRVFEFYGATEGNVNMINFLGRVGSVGMLPPGPLDNTFLARFDPETQRPVRGVDGRCVKCAAGEPGELLGRINPDRVTQRFDGYLDEGATEGKVLRDVVEPGDAWFRSGDLLRKDRLGWFYFVDRIGDTFRWKGENVSTNAVAGTLTEHPDIDVANVYGVEVPGADGRAGMVALVPRDGATLDPRELYGFVDRELAPFERPAVVRLVDTAALTATFKLRKVDLVEAGFDPSAIDDALWFRNDDAGTYEVLDDDAWARIHDGEIRF